MTQTDAGVSPDRAEVAPRRRSLAGPLVKSGIFIVVTALITALLGISIANTGVSATAPYRAVFSDVTGLTVGDNVDIAGVSVGEVTSISVYDRDLALVGFSIQSYRVLPASVTATIKYLNLVGQRYIELAQGTGPPGRNLPVGGTIPLSQTTPAVSLTELFDGFQPLFSALSPGDVNQLASELIEVLQGESPNITTLVATVGSLTTTLASRNQVIDAVIDNLDAVIQTISTRSTALAGLISTLQQLVSGLAADRQPIGNAIAAISSLTSATAGLLQVARPPLEADITQLGRLATNLADNSPLVNSFLQTLPAKMTDIARLASYGSWLNFFLCSATVTGVSNGFGGPGPTGIPVTAARCTS
jgi:phospholipid/cholesterol/gamma-HCH transport system substrate-binding protein